MLWIVPDPTLDVGRGLGEVQSSPLLLLAIVLNFKNENGFKNCSETHIMRNTPS